MVPHRIVLLGATGHIGRLVAAALVRAGVRPLLACRSAQDLAALGVQLGRGLPTITIDVGDAEGLSALIEPGDVVVNTVGPFAQLGRPVVEAAIRRRATYLDCSAEPDFIRTVYGEYDAVAQQAGVALVPGVGYEFTAGNLAACLALEGLGGDAARIEIGYFPTGQAHGEVSVARRRSRAEAALAAPYAWRGGRLITSSFGDRVATFSVDAVDRRAVAIGGSEHIAVPWLYPSVLDVGVYSGRNARRVARAATVVARWAYRLPGVPPVVRWVAARPHRTGEYGAPEHVSEPFRVIAAAYDSDGRSLRRVNIRGRSEQGFTAEILAWAAQRAAADELQAPGAHGPMEAFGLCRVRDACAELAVATFDVSAAP